MSRHAAPTKVTHLPSARAGDRHSEPPRALEQPLVVGDQPAQISTQLAGCCEMNGVKGA
jgi:uncharacterized Zn-binding protein involved in type VI secretion